MRDRGFRAYARVRSVLARGGARLTPSMTAAAVAAATALRRVMMGFVRLVDAWIGKPL